MKKIILLFLFPLFISCERDEVQLSTLDIFTDGNEKDWVIEELILYGTQNYEECYMGAVFQFSKVYTLDTTYIGPTSLFYPAVPNCSSEKIKFIKFIENGNKVEFYSSLDSYFNYFPEITFNIVKATPGKIILEHNDSDVGLTRYTLVSKEKDKEE